MEKLSKKGILLFVGAMAVCAFAMPSMISAASWGVIGTEHTLHSPDFGFSTTIPVIGPVSSACSSSTLTADVRSASALTVTSASFRGCTASGPGIGTCTVTETATPNPTPDWRVTGLTTSNIQFHGVVIDMTFQTRSGLCLNVAGVGTTVTGTLGGGQWTGNGANQHEVVFSDDEGFVMHTPAGTAPLTIRGTFRDTQQTLILS
jgi:hypothetical protein